MFVVCCVGSGLCDELITRPEESYKMRICLIVYYLETSKMSSLGQSGALAPCGK
jgi:hypothetical protein